VLRPVVDKNTQGPGAYSGAPYSLALNADGTKVYGYDYYWSVFDFKREAILPDGIHYLSGATELIGGYSVAMYSAGGLIFTPGGAVVDPERGRVIARLPLPSSGIIAPDPSSGRIYAISGSQIMVFDSTTYDMIGSMSVGAYNQQPLSLARYGSDGLAFHTSDGQIFFVQISAIPALAKPVPGIPRTLPSNPGVTVVDLAARDLVYDPARDRIYLSTPNSEMANGDQIVTLDPANGSIADRRPGGANPGMLAMASDQSRLFFAGGTAGLEFYSGYSLNSEVIHEMLLDSGEVASAFPKYPDYLDMSYRALDIAALPGQPRSVATIDLWTQSAGGGVGSAPGALRIFDAGVARPKYLLPHTFNCTYLVAGADATKLYCSDTSVITRLAVDDQGVTQRDFIRLLPGPGTFGRMVYAAGRIYTTTGNVVDVETGRIVTRVGGGGPVAVDGEHVYWLVPSSSGDHTATLLTYDRATLQQTGTRQIKVSALDFKRLVPCGQGRLAFAAGKEVYIVNP
jgi:hypothetical protein